MALDMTQILKHDVASLDIMSWTELLHPNLFRGTVHQALKTLYRRLGPTARG
jgi:hypothetical protein